MSARRVLFAFLVTLGCALVVFTLPRFVFNTLSGASVQTAAQDTAKAQVVAPEPRSLGSRLTGIFGIILILGIGVGLSRNRRAISRRVVAWGVGLQLVFAIFVLRVPVGQKIFSWLGATVTKILGFSYAGSEFVFGEIGKQQSSLGVVFAFQVLPAIIFVSALFAILYYLGIMQIIVRAFAALMSRVMGASGAESLNVAASIFMGQTEAPLTIRPFLPRMTRSELMTVMTAGMAHVSGSIMAAYIAFGIEARHLLTAVIMTAPGTIMMAKILEPETEVPETLGGVKVEIPRTDVNVLDAAARGTGEGLHLMLNVIAMLISFIALIALINGGFGLVHHYVAWFPESLQTVLGWIFRPIAWVMGVPWHDSGTVGALLGERMVINEFIAYAHLGPLMSSLDPVSFTIATFALCGFANLSSVGIQIGGIGALAPERKHDLARLGFRAMVAGTLEGVPVVVQAGRFHLYEGHPAAVAGLPARVFAELGVEVLIVTNAAGGVRRTFPGGTLMLIADHINLMWRNPLIGQPEPGEERFPIMHAPYDQELRTLAREVARDSRIRMEEGVYAALLGPSYETPSEVRMLERLGADAVGMSTVPEVLVARSRGIRCLGFSIITNPGAGITGEALSHEEVLVVSERVARQLSVLLKGILSRIAVA